VPETIYLDTCALNRPSDDLSQPRIRREAEAIGRIMDLVHDGRVEWYFSPFLRLEIERNPDPMRRIRALDLLTSAKGIISPTKDTVAEAERLITLGFARFDALHAALAHEAQIDWFITTDDRLLRAANRHLQTYRPILVNPVDWLQRRQPWLLQPPSSPAN
jgi:predicted nucleic acid-binding protein